MATPGSDIDNKKQGTEGKSGPPEFSRSLIYLLIFGLALLLYFMFGRNPSMQETTFKQFKDEMLTNKEVSKIAVINKERAEIYLTEEALKKEKYSKVGKGLFGNVNYGPHYYFSIGTPEVFEEKLAEAQAAFSESEKIPVVYESEGNIWMALLIWLLPIGAMIALMIFISRRISTAAGKTGGSFFDFGKSRAQVYEKGKSNPVTFKDIAGYDEAKTEIMEIVEFLRKPERFTRLGAKIPKGVLLVGSPGTGKTLLAKAVAGEAGVPFYSLSGSEFVEMFVGVGASRVRDLFKTAKQKAPSIIFIDEIDTIGRMRGKSVSLQANDERESTLNQLLAEMDGFDANTGVIIMAATNRADVLDPALLRPGRFDRHIHLDLPDVKEREAIFNVHMKRLKMDNSVDVKTLSAQTPGFSGADISNVCNEAALIAARINKDAVQMEDFYSAIDRVIAGMEKKNKIMTLDEKRTIAYHEAGHAIVGWMLKDMDPLLKVSIIPRGKSLGAAWYLPAERKIVTKRQYFERLCATLGGRVAEEIVFGEISSGALDDLERITKQAYMMVAQLGMSEQVGNLSYYDSTGQMESSFQKPYSEEMARLIDEEVQKLVSEAHRRTKEILESNREKLDTLANQLLSKEVVYKEQLESILGKKAVREPSVPQEETIMAFKDVKPD